MSKSLVIGLTLAASGLGGTVAALGSVASRITNIGSTIDKLKSRQTNAMSAMTREWAWGGDSVKKYSAEVERLDKKIVALSNRKIAIGQISQQHEANRADLNSSYSNLLGAYAIGRTIGAPVGAAIRQEDAINQLQVSMLDVNNKIDASFDGIKHQAIELGNILPGTTAEFVGVARGLIDQGVAFKSVAQGGLDAAAKLSVVLKLSGYETASLVAKQREAYKLADDELPKMADMMQKAKFVFGMQPQDLEAATSYDASTLRMLNLSGADNAKKVLALQGMGAQASVDGSQFGTAFKDLLHHFAVGPKMVEMATKGMKAEAADIMAKHQIKFDFFDKKGTFVGLESSIQELEKLKKLSQEEALEVTHAIFGEQAGNAAMIFSDLGFKGYQEALAKMDAQASLQQRIALVMQTTKAKTEALTGSIENLGAAVAGPAVKAFDPLTEQLNGWTGELTNFFDANPVFTKWFGMVVGTVGAAAGTFLALGTAIRFLRFAGTGIALFPGVLKLGAGLKSLAKPLIGSVGLLKAFGKGILWLGRAMLLNPIGIAITALAIGAILLYKYWQPVTAFLGRAWTWVNSVFAKYPILNYIFPLVGIARLLINNWDKIPSWFAGMWSRFKATGVVAWSWFSQLPGQFATIGSQMIDGLINGLTNKLTAAKATIVGFGQNVKGWFASTLGIQSPSRVFMGYGHNIGQGAEMGILQSAPGVKSATRKMAGLALAGAMSATSVFAHVPAASASYQRLQSGPAAQGGHQGGMTINFAPTITITGAASTGVREQVNQGLNHSMRELEKMLKRIERERERRAY